MAPDDLYAATQAGPVVWGIRSRYPRRVRPKHDDCTKGLVFRHAIEFVRESFGTDAYRTVLDVASQQGIPVRLDDIVTGGWYPTENYIALIELIARSYLEADASRCMEIGRYAVEQDLNGVYRAFVMVLSPGFFLRMAPAMWRQYHSAGTLSVPERGDGHCRFVIERETNPSIHEWYVVIGGALRALEFVGAKNVRYDIIDGLQSDRPGIRFEVRCAWD